MKSDNEKLKGLSDFGEFCENGPLKTEKWSANNKKFISRPKSSFWRGHF